MRFLIVDAYQDDSLVGLYRSRPSLFDEPYERQHGALMRQFLSSSDFFTACLREQGHDATSVVANCETLQRKWASEHGLALPVEIPASKAPGQGLLAAFRPRKSPAWMAEVLWAQVEAWSPDIVLVCSCELVAGELLFELKRSSRRIIGLHSGSTAMSKLDWKAYDLVLTPSPAVIRSLQKRRINSNVFPNSFEPKVRNAFASIERTIPVSFIGSFDGQHSRRTRLLNYLAEFVPLAVWGPPLPPEVAATSLAKCYHGPAWGSDMFNVLAQSKIVVDCHKNGAEYSTNRRLFEATGMGAMLVTDAYSNLAGLFEIGREIVSYSSDNQCIETVMKYLGDDEARNAIAAAGARRTSNDHTYGNRTKDLLSMLDSNT